jgi:hypothetical protein
MLALRVLAATRALRVANLALRWAILSAVVISFLLTKFLESQENLSLHRVHSLAGGLLVSLNSLSVLGLAFAVLRGFPDYRGGLLGSSFFSSRRLVSSLPHSLIPYIRIVSLSCNTCQ